MKNFDSIMPWDTMFDYSDLMRKLRRIERLLYFREWAVILRDKTGSPIYFDMLNDIFNRLWDMGVVLPDIGKIFNEGVLGNP